MKTAGSSSPFQKLLQQSLPQIVEGVLPQAEWSAGPVSLDRPQDRRGGGALMKFFSPGFRGNNEGSAGHRGADPQQHRRSASVHERDRAGTDRARQTGSQGPGKELRSGVVMLRMDVVGVCFSSVLLVCCGGSGGRAGQQRRRDFVVDSERCCVEMEQQYVSPWYYSLLCGIRSWWKSANRVRFSASS